MLAAGTYSKEYVDACGQKNLLLPLDGHFVHRLRGVEGKNGNPLNELRVWTQP